VAAGINFAIAQIDADLRRCLPSTRHLVQERRRLHRLTVRHGVDAKLFDWFDEIATDRPHKIAYSLSGFGQKCLRGVGASGIGSRIESNLGKR
jgi:hypothetical protein